MQIDYGITTCNPYNLPSWKDRKQNETWLTYSFAFPRGLNNVLIMWIVFFAKEKILKSEAVATDFWFTVLTLTGALNDKFTIYFNFVQSS